MKEFSVMGALARLAEIIDQKKSYAQKSNSSFVKREAEELEQIHKNISLLINPDAVLDIQKEIARMKRQDPELDGVTIEISFKQRKKNWGFMKIDWI